jgi:hypothetical protein
MKHLIMIIASNLLFLVLFMIILVSLEPKDEPNPNLINELLETKHELAETLILLEECENGL